MKPQAPKPTVVEAKVDVGFGNRLFIRGEGGGLTWHKGKPLICQDGASWVWSGEVDKGELVFKLLLNDKQWCIGEDIRVGAGHHVEVVPVFEQAPAT